MSLERPQRIAAPGFAATHGAVRFVLAGRRGGRIAASRRPEVRIGRPPRIAAPGFAAALVRDAREGARSAISSRVPRRTSPSASFSPAGTVVALPHRGGQK
jgi:hypothetical protein